jgi:hypothetical protein
VRDPTERRRDILAAISARERHAPSDQVAFVQDELDQMFA